MNEQFLEHLGEGIDVLTGLAEKQLSRATENESSFNLALAIDITSLATTTDRLRPYLDLLHVAIEYQIQDGHGISDLHENGNLVVHQWETDDTLSPPDLLLPAAVEAHERLRQSLAQEKASISAATIATDLSALDQVGADITLNVVIDIDKSAIVSKIDCPSNVRLLFYVLTSKFLRQLESKEISNLESFLSPNQEDALVLLLSDIVGIGTGPNLRVSGRHNWHATAIVKFLPDEVDCRKISSTKKFKSDECNWEIATSGVTPHHLYLERSSMSRSELTKSIGRLRDQLAVMYMADHVKVVDGQIQCQFRGYKRSWVRIPARNAGESSPSIFSLFAWAYDNSSSDKLGIARQMISLYLDSNIDGNYLALMEKAHDILGTAKGNFQLLLRGNAELYFDKRLKVSQFLQKFSEDVGHSVSQMTSELISNLYKTIGVLIGVIVTGIVDASLIPKVIYWTALFYLAYIVFIVVYLLPSVLYIFIDRATTYRKSVQELTDVLSKEEIARLEGNTFKRAKWLFWIYFIVTTAIYVGLAFVAYEFMRSNS